MMKTIYKISMFIAAAMAFGSCAKNVSVGVNEADKRYFDAWLSVNAPEAEREGRGIYVFPEYTVEGTGATVEKDGFVIWKYVIRNLDGSIISYTDKQHAEQLGSYDPASYYGVQVQTTTPETNVSSYLSGLCHIRTLLRRKNTLLRRLSTATPSTKSK